jgi:site-specific DNA recombinase
MIPRGANKRSGQCALQRLRLVAKIEHDVEQFLDRIAHATVPSVTAPYENRIWQLEERRIELSEKTANCGRPLRSFVLTSPCNLWASERLEDKKKVLKLAFADRLAYV